MWFGPRREVLLKVIDSWVSCPMVFQTLIASYHHNGWKLTWNLSFEKIDEQTFFFLCNKGISSKVRTYFSKYYLFVKPSQ